MDSVQPFPSLHLILSYIILFLLTIFLGQICLPRITSGGNPRLPAGSKLARERNHVKGLLMQCPLKLDSDLLQQIINERETDPYRLTLYEQMVMLLPMDTLTLSEFDDVVRHYDSCVLKVWSPDDGKVEVPDRPPPLPAPCNRPFPAGIDIHKHLSHGAVLTGAVQIAGRPKGQKEMVTTITGGRSRTIATFGADCVGVSQDGLFMVVADGVGRTNSPHKASRAAVLLSLLYHERHPDWALAYYGPQLLKEIQKFFRIFSLLGATTFTAVRLDRKSMNAEILHVGDSAAMIVDPNGKIVFLTKDNWRAINCPVSLRGTCPAKSNEIMMYSCGVKPGWRIIIGSDGLFDNFYPEWIANLDSAGSIAAHAAAVAYEKCAQHIPYNDKMDTVAKKHRPYKPDDISIALLTVPKSY